MIVLSLIVNVLVLVPVLVGLLRDSAGMADTFGVDTPARAILVSVYLAIALLSAVLLLAPPGARADLVPGLLAVQIIYKVITVALLGPTHPVALANLLIAALHGVTFVTLYR